MSDSDQEPDRSPELEDLCRRLREARGKDKVVPDGGKPGASGPGRALALGLRLATELVAGVAVGTLIGWGLDRWLGTGPFLLVLFLLLGAGAGFMNVIRAARQAEKD